MFRLGMDKKTMVMLFIVIAVLKVLSTGDSISDGILDLLLMTPGVLIALTFHEFAHAYVAYKLGDQTPKVQGRLNLNPLNHLDPMGTAFLIIAGFGWGKPVEINPNDFSGKHSISKAEAMVAAAGPIANFIVAFIFYIIMYAIFYIAKAGGSLNTYAIAILDTVVYGIIVMNLGLRSFQLNTISTIRWFKDINTFFAI